MQLVVTVRRYLCTGCDSVLTVVPREIVARRHFSAGIGDVRQIPAPVLLHAEVLEDQAVDAAHAAEDHVARNQLATPNGLGQVAECGVVIG